MAIPVNAVSEVITGKSIRSEETGMEFNASVVKAMTSNLYNYKIEAVLREYSTNITDIHNDSGMEGVAGYVKLPTKFDPTVEFRDKGRGMNEEDIYGTFTILGKSTKRGDNTTNGSLGFGSKSYVTVADQMTVTSVKDGVKTVVLCYKNRKGSLSADTKHVSKTDEQNGTTISIPVDLGKVNTWLSTAARVLGAFRTPHEVNSFGEYELEYDQMLALCRSVREEGSVFYQTNNRVMNNMRSRAFALMGDVMYELPDYETLFPVTRVTSVAKSVLSSGFYCASFEIGELDHAPSREAISYDDETYLKVKHRVRKDFVKEVNKFNEMLGGEDMTYYKFHHKFSGTKVMESLAGMRLPFLKGESVSSLSGESKKVAFLDDKKVFGSVRGYIARAVGYGDYVYSSNVQGVYQRRLLNIKNPLILYSENNKGIYKINQTLDTARKGWEGDILVCENKIFADNLFNFFGCGEVQCGDKYSPEKWKRQVGKVGSRTHASHGIKEDWETVGQVREINGNSYTSHYGKVDLSEEGVYFLDDKDNYMKVKGVVKNSTTYLNMDSRISSILSKYGVKKVVLVNLNNKGKVTRSGIKNIDTVWTKIIKEHKADIIKALVWAESTGVYGYEKLLAKGLPEYRKMVSRKPCEASVAYNLTRVSNFNLHKTPKYQQEELRRVSLYRKVTEKVQAKKEKLPLWNIVSRQDQKSVEYYLKLEKVIK